MPGQTSRFVGEAPAISALSAEVILARAALAVRAVDEEILASEQVATDAMVLPGVLGGRGNSSAHVLRAGHNLEMSRIHASMITTEMINLHGWGYCRDKKLIGDAVYKLRPSVNLELSVALRIVRTAPSPTAARPFHSSFEAFGERNHVASRVAQ